MLVSSIADSCKDKMLTGIYHPNAVSACVGHILSKIDYNKLTYAVENAVLNSDKEHRVVVFEYVHSGIIDSIAQIERVPGTIIPIHDVLSSYECITRLDSLLRVPGKTSWYSRRKIDHAIGELTIKRQLVLLIEKDAFAPVLLERTETLPADLTLHPPPLKRTSKISSL